MKKIFKTTILIIALLVLSISLVACSNSNEEKLGGSLEDGQDIKLGCMSSSEPIIRWLKEGLDPMGYNVEIVMFDGNHLPATALADGNIDGLILNYLPWLKTFNEKNNTNLHMVEPYIYYTYTAVYSSRYNSLEELPQDAQIAVPGDPTNLERALKRLQKSGIITLGDKKESFYTILDIKENPKNIKIIETEVTTTARSINDVDAILITADGMRRAGIDPQSFIYPSKAELDEELAIFLREKEKGNSLGDELIFISPDFGLIIGQDDIEAEWVKDAVSVYQSEEFIDKFNNHFKGSYILYDN